jgi:hypothetical protein
VRVDGLGLRRLHEHEERDPQGRGCEAEDRSRGSDEAVYYGLYARGRSIPRPLPVAARCTTESEPRLGQIRC